MADSLLFLLIGGLGGVMVLKVFMRFFKEMPQNHELAEELKTRLAWLGVAAFFFIVSSWVFLWPNGWHLPDDPTKITSISIGYGLPYFFVYMTSIVMGCLSLWFAVSLNKVKAWEARHLG